MHELPKLRAQLAAIQTALAEDALEHLPLMVQDYHTHLHAFMAAGIGTTDAAIEPLQQLRALHHEVIARMQQRQQHLHARMQADRHSARAARAYLSTSPS